MPRVTVSFIKDTYPHKCPLHYIVKDILYVQAQKGRAEEIPPKCSFKKKKVIPPKNYFLFFIFPPKDLRNIGQWAVESV